MRDTRQACLSLARAVLRNGNLSPRFGDTCTARRAARVPPPFVGRSFVRPRLRVPQGFRLPAICVYEGRSVLLLPRRVPRPDGAHRNAAPALAPRSGLGSAKPGRGLLRSSWKPAGGAESMSKRWLYGGLLLALVVALSGGSYAL